MISNESSTVWKPLQVSNAIRECVRGKSVCDLFLGPGGLAIGLCASTSRYQGCEISSEMRRSFASIRRIKSALRKVKALPVDGFKFGRVAAYDIAILDPPWGGYQVFLGKRYVLARRNRRVVDLALHILRAGREVVFVLPFHTVLPPRLERWKFFESDVIKKHGRDYCKVWAFRR
jgi:predicted RNA methylase